MINLYCTADKGLAKELKQNFLRDNPDCLHINCADYEQLFQMLLQNSLFENQNSYIIDNASLLSLNWRNMASKNESLETNNKKIDELTRILTGFKNENKNVLVLVYAPKLLANKTVKNLFLLFDNYNEKNGEKNFLIASLNQRTKAEYIDKCVKNLNIKFDEKANNYLYEFFPKNAEFINGVFEKAELLGTKEISFDDLQQLSGNFHDVNYFLLVDNWMLNNPTWINFYNEKCLTDADAGSLLNIFIFRLSELFHYAQLRLKGWNSKEICGTMKKTAFMLAVYEKIYNLHRQKINSKLVLIIVKLYEYTVKSKRRQFVTVQNLKKILLNL